VNTIVLVLRYLESLDGERPPDVCPVCETNREVRGPDPIYHHYCPESDFEVFWFVYDP